MKKLKALALAALVAFGTIATPQKSHAMLLIGAIIGQLHFDGDEEMLLCLVILPICLLDSKGPSEGLNEDMLMKNGYSPNEAKDVMKGYEMHRTFISTHGTDALQENPHGMLQDLMKLKGMPPAYLKLLNENGL